MNDRLAKIESALDKAIDVLSKQIAASQNFDQLTECVTHLRILLPILDAADMLQYVRNIHNEISKREKELS